MKSLFHRLKRNQRGVTTLEYAILAVVVTAAVVVLSPTIATLSEDVFDKVKSSITNAADDGTPTSPGVPY